MHIKRYIKTIGIMLCFSLLNMIAGAEIRMPSFFSEGMVLQRGMEVPVWGWAEPGSNITVEFAGQKKTGVADENGRWQVSLDPMSASSAPRTMTVYSIGNQKSEIGNVVVGEVWLASGQSNMAWMMSQSSSREYAGTVNKSLIRHYQGQDVSRAEPQDDFVGEWVAATEGKTSRFSAVAFHFAEKLYDELEVPVGIIDTAWGGMPIQSFISDEAIRKIPEAQDDVERKAKAIREYDPDQALAEYEQRLKVYETARQQWLDGGGQGRGPKKPGIKESPATAPRSHSNIFNGMIHPLVGYGIRGAIWYQGEANAGRGELYGPLLKGVSDNWRSLWGSEFSFYWVQLANFRESINEPGQNVSWVTMQNEQRRALKMISKSGMAVINDIGARGIHPGNKKDVGLRLARWALHQDYALEELSTGGKGKNVVPSGPLYRATQFENGKAIVSFDYAKGLQTRDGEQLGRFELAGTDGRWVWGDAVIQGETVVVTAPSVKQAIAVRYAWAQNPEGANLVNAAGLPASCFSAVAE